MPFGSYINLVTAHPLLHSVLSRTGHVNVSTVVSCVMSAVQSENTESCGVTSLAAMVDRFW